MAASSLPRRLATAVSLAMVVSGLALVHPSPAAAAGGGYVRLGHLVPDEIACDMYLQLHSVTGDVVKYLPSVKYGAVSEYVMVPAGTYAVAMRKPGAKATEPPALSTSLTVADGRAYTVARMGAPGAAEARIINDDRRLPSDGKAKLRVVQAAQRTLDVSVADGPTIAKDVAFTTTTDYRGVDPGDRTLRVQPAGGQPVTVKAAVTAGSVYSLVVLDTPEGGVRAVLLADALRQGRVPQGGVETGAGGSAGPEGGNAPVLIAAGLLLVLSAGALVAMRARRRGPVPVRACRSPVERR